MAEEQQFELQRLEKFLVPNLLQLKLLLQQTEEQRSHAKSLVDKLPYSKKRDELRRQIRLEKDDANSLLERAGKTPGVSSQSLGPPPHPALSPSPRRRKYRVC